MIKEQRYKILGVLFLVAALIAVALGSVDKPNLLEVYFYNVGEGDSTFIETPARDQILVDGGPNNTVVQKLGRTMPFYDKKIEMIVLTHPDSDHLFGLVEVLKRYDVDMILTPDIPCDTSICKQWDDLIKSKNIPVKTALVGEKIDLGDKLSIDILSAADGNGGSPKDNSSSLVFRLDFGKDSFLFTGDAEKDTEEKLINSGENITAEVLKVGHHGSKTSTEESFLEKVAPKIAVISVGKNNRYGHPTDEVLERLKSFGAEIFRTDQSGDIRIFSDGKGLVWQ